MRTGDLPKQQHKVLYEGLVAHDNGGCLSRGDPYLLSSPNWTTGRCPGNKSYPVAMSPRSARKSHPVHLALPSSPLTKEDGKRRARRQYQQRTPPVGWEQERAHVLHPRKHVVFTSHPYPGYPLVVVMQSPVLHVCHHQSYLCPYSECCATTADHPASDPFLS